jgi:hypothetical protein
MYGRGVAVSKSDFATYAWALKALEEVERAGGTRLAGTVELHLTYDEEAGGNIGPGFLLREGVSEPDLAISAGFSYGVTTAHNGCLHLEVEVNGRSAHAAMPFTGIDALEAATGVLSALYAWRKTLAERTSAIPGIGSPQMTVGLVKGGINTNVVPDRVTFRLDRRMIPGGAPGGGRGGAAVGDRGGGRGVPRAKVEVRASSWSSPRTPAGRRADDRAALPPRDPGDGRAGPDQGRAALHRRAALRLARDPDRALRRRARTRSRRPTRTAPTSACRSRTCARPPRSWRSPFSTCWRRGAGERRDGAGGEKTGHDDDRRCPPARGAKPCSPSAPGRFRPDPPYLFKRDVGGTRRTAASGSATRVPARSSPSVGAVSASPATSAARSRPPSAPDSV